MMCTSRQATNLTRGDISSKDGSLSADCTIRRSTPAAQAPECSRASSQRNQTSRLVERSRSRTVSKRTIPHEAKHTTLPGTDGGQAPETRSSGSELSYPEDRTTFVGSANEIRLPTEMQRSSSHSSTMRSEEGTSLLNSFTPSQIQAHLQSLKSGVRLTAAKIRQKCMPVLKKLTEQENAWIFMQPVDPVELNLPDYFDLIKNPMDLGTIKKRLENSNYKAVSEFVADIRLTFGNAIAYNGDGSDVCKVAKDMKASFERLYQSMIASIDAEEEQRKSSGDVCVLCGCEKLLFEPTVYYCNGTCNGQRIRRNSYYYTGGRNQYHWCQQCFNELKEKEPLEFPDLTLWKHDLQKKKNDEMHEEPWVECSQCKRWVHQICALFNGRMNKGTTIYHCPFCFMARRGSREPHPRPLGAKDIRHTKLSRYLEQRVMRSLEDGYVRLESTPEVRSEKAPPVCVRQLSNIDKVHQVKPRMQQHCSDIPYPREFPVRSKCIFLFQDMDGVDVILFGMYLYEYGQNCPEPNRRRVYVSYLDSVYYFRPRQCRTLVYHEMLIAYLAHVKQRGFHTAHIWACPPCKGDDYIFFCHPEDQKTPKDDRLRSWYITLLRKAKDEGIVTRITNLWDDHFKADLDATCVPYFEGDYWPGEAENVLKALEDESNERSDGKARKSSCSAKSKSKARGTRGLRSDGATECEKGQDPLIFRMGRIIEPMKDAFIVAYLHPRVLARAMCQRAPGSELSGHIATNVGHNRDHSRILATGPSIEHAVDDVTSSPKSDARCIIQKETSTVQDTAEPCYVSMHNAQGNPQTGVSSNRRRGSRDTPVDVRLDSQKGRGDGDYSPVGSSQGYEQRRLHASIHGESVDHPDETEDSDEIIESEFYDTRQQFLNLCQGNHYQFDELRRAKHTSMMSLYHMHNPDVPKFTVACSNCGSDINTGVCFNSEKDPEFHLCQASSHHVRNMIVLNRIVIILIRSTL